ATPIVDKIGGRDDDYVILKNGTRIGRIDIAFKGISNVLFAQILQEQLGVIIVNLVPGLAFNSKNSEQIISNLKKLLGDDVILMINIVDEHEIIRSSKGKYKLVINKLLTTKKDV